MDFVWFSFSHNSHIITIMSELDLKRKIVITYKLIWDTPSFFFLFFEIIVMTPYYFIFVSNSDIIVIYMLWKIFIGILNKKLLTWKLWVNKTDAGEFSETSPWKVFAPAYSDVIGIYIIRSIFVANSIKTNIDFYGSYEATKS